MNFLLYLLLLFTPYTSLNCSQFVNTQHKTFCNAAQLYRGCGGRLVQVSDPKPGDVVAFNGRHVGVYVSKSFVLDSTPENGVMLHKIPKCDPWYVGPKYLRWKKGE